VPALLRVETERQY